MKRRDFVKHLGAPVVGALLAPSLSACGKKKKKSQPDPNPPVTPGNQYSQGLIPATESELQELPVIDSKVTYALASGDAASYTPPTYFNLADASLMAQYGFPQLMPPVGDQGSKGSCVGWGVGYAMASATRALATGTAPDTSATQASPEDLYVKALARGGFACANGTIIRDAMTILIETGAASFSSAPYDARSCSSASSRSDFRIDSCILMSPTDIAGIKNALLSCSALPFGMTVYDDFYSVGRDQNAIYSRPASAGGPARGGHCMCLVGYDDSRQAFRVQNSWGTYWGNNGYIWFDYATFGRIARDVYFPYLTSRYSKSNFLYQPQSESGPLKTLSAYSFTPRNQQTGAFDTVGFQFALNDVMYLEYYALYFQQGGTTNVTRISEKYIKQAARGMIVQSSIDPSILTPSGYFTLVIVGKSRDGTMRTLNIATNYPGSGGR